MIAQSALPRGFVRVEQATVVVIDDDGWMREGLRNLFRSVNLRVEAFSSIPEFSRSRLQDVANCLVLDIRLPGLSGLDFQTQLARTGAHVPIVFMTGHGDVPMSVKAMKAGAIDFLTKPFREQEMLDAVTRAIEQDLERRDHEKMVSELRARYETLSSREREVLALVATGLMNKVIATELNIAEITVKIHRGRVMRKMGAHSFADLMKMAHLLEIQPARP